jgi:hypothetical protein
MLNPSPANLVREMSARLAMEHFLSADRLSELLRRMARGQISAAAVGRNVVQFARESAGDYGRNVLGLSLSYPLALLGLGRDYGDRLLDRILGGESMDLGKSARPSQHPEMTLTGQLGESASATFAIANDRPGPVEISFIVSEFTDGQRLASFRPPVQLSPSRLMIAPGHEEEVTLDLKLLPELFNPGTVYRATLLARDQDPTVEIYAIAHDERVTPTETSHTRTWVPTSPLAQAVDEAGFLYDPDQDIIYSKMYPFQRQLGYAYAYDAGALAMSAVLDCEPIFFDYNGKTWMIELWKGQYALETGCEIGVYSRPIVSSSPLYDLLDETVGRRERDPNPSHNLFFDCVDDPDRLLLSSVLYRNGQKLFSRGPESHWWLTGFKWGVLSRPEDLTMELSITCPNAEMLTALVAALQNTGYDELNVWDNRVEFTFDKPFTFQPRRETPEVVAAVNDINGAEVDAYNALGFPNNDPNEIESGADRLIANSISIYSRDFFARVDSGFIQAAGIDLPPSLLQSYTRGHTVGS